MRIRGAEGFEEMTQRTTFIDPKKEHSMNANASAHLPLAGKKGFVTFDSR